MYAKLPVPHAPGRQDLCIFPCPTRPWEAGCMHICTSRAPLGGRMYAYLRVIATGCAKLPFVNRPALKSPTVNAVGAVNR